MTFSSNLYASLWCDPNTTQKLICFRVSLKPERRSFAQDSSCKPSLKGLEAATVHLDTWQAAVIFSVSCIRRVWQYPLKNKQCLGHGNKTDQNIFQNWPQMHLISFTLGMCMVLNRGLGYIDTASEAPLGCMRRLRIGISPSLTNPKQYTFYHYLIIKISHICMILDI